MQLISYGAQDIYLTGNPEITYFKVVYRRHTNFSMETVMQTFTGPADFNKRVTSLISRGGDLITGLYLQTTLPDIVATGDHQRWTDNLGHYLIKEVSIDIGGQEIDRHYGDWLEVWSQLSVPAGKMAGYLEMIGQDPTNPLGMNMGLQRDVANDYTIPGRTIFIPLQFWFCRHVGLALPMISLQHHEVRVHITLSEFSSMVVNYRDTGNGLAGAGEPLPTGSLSGTELWADYIYLDTDERRRFAQISHEYLIEQLQCISHHVPGHATETTAILNFHHPVKELVWVSRFDSATDYGVNQWANYTTVPASITSLGSATGFIGGLSNLGQLPTVSTSALCISSYARPPLAKNHTDSAKLILNGNDRFAIRGGRYFNWVQCNDHHTNIPRSPGINVYSFAIEPEGHQPSGSTNFSRINEAKLYMRFNDGSSLTDSVSFTGSARTVKIYAVNYNVLRVMCGMAGLAYTE